jgi:hypothetical protein
MRVGEFSVSRLLTKNCRILGGKKCPMSKLPNHMLGNGYTVLNRLSLVAITHYSAPYINWAEFSIG